MFIGVTAEKLIGGPFCRGAEFIQNFQKGEIAIPYRGKFRWEKVFFGKNFCHLANFRHFSPTKSFSSDIMNILDLS